MEKNNYNGLCRLATALGSIQFEPRLLPHEVVGKKDPRVEDDQNLSVCPVTATTPKPHGNAHGQTQIYPADSVCTPAHGLAYRRHSRGNSRFSLFLSFIKAYLTSAKDRILDNASDTLGFIKKHLFGDRCLPQEGSGIVKYAFLTPQR